MLISVDGTGTAEGTMGDLVFGTKNRAANFAVQMMGSFVGMIHYGSHLPNRRYYQGPDLTGTGPNLARPFSLYQQIREFWRQGDQEIFMAGYSRGAAIVINTAAILGVLPMPDGKYARIEAMFLFDAVSRSVELPWSRLIPSNVDFCYHAMRDDRAHSRWTFGHCGTAMEGASTYLVKRPFYTTHGGMGGAPWGKEGLLDFTKESLTASEMAARARHIDGRYVYGGPKLDGSDLDRWMLANEHIYEGGVDGITNVTVAQEKQGSDAVHAWMWPFLRKHGVR